MARLKNLKAEMARRGMTQHDLAIAVGTTDAAVCRWVKGEREPRARYALAIARCFPDCSTDYLFEGLED